MNEPDDLGFLRDATLEVEENDAMETVTVMKVRAWHRSRQPSTYLLGAYFLVIIATIIWAATVPFFDARPTTADPMQTAAH